MIVAAEGTHNSVTVRWKVFPVNYPFKTYVIYGTDRNDPCNKSEVHTIEAIHDAENQPKEMQVQLKNLEQNTIYYYCAVTKNDHGEASATDHVQTLG